MCVEQEISEQKGKLLADDFGDKLLGLRALEPKIIHECFNLCFEEEEEEEEQEEEETLLVNDTTYKSEILRLRNSSFK